MMNSYTEHLEPAPEEIRAFASSETGADWDEGWYQQIESLVQKAADASDDDGAERYLDMLLWCIVDSGPLGKGFAPSIDKAADAMQRKRKQAFKKQRESDRRSRNRTSRSS
jgi:hypothetical protein